MQLQSLSYSNSSGTIVGLTYGYGTGDNGQIQSVTDSADAGRTANYTYDAWARLKTAQTTGDTAYPAWGLSFTYDRYGNRTAQSVTTGSAPANSLSFSTTGGALTNHADTFSYDASGNMLSDGTNTLTYDAENRTLTSAGTLGSATYTYDGNGLRVEKSGSNGSTIYIFSGAKVIGEYAPGAQPSSPTTEYIYAGANLVASITAGTPTYSHPDQLSARALTSSTGSVVGQQGNYPFGESWYSSGTTTKWKFTSYERDPESANDYAMARYDINRLGRFNSPDPVPGSIADPQSFNRYSYVRNNPLTLVDPTGLDCVYFGSDGSTIESVDHSSGWDECYTNGGNWVNGTVTGWSYDPGTDTFTIQSSDTWYNYTTTQSAPGPEIIGSCSGDCIYSYSQSFSFGLSNLMNQPWMASIIIPVAPVPYLAGVGPAGSLAYNPKTHTLCAGLGIGAAGGKSVAGGPLSFGKMFNGQDYPSGANNLLSGGSISVGGNFVAILGGQLTINGSGVAVGPTIGAPGAGISATYSVCF